MCTEIYPDLRQLESLRDKLPTTACNDWVPGMASRVRMIQSAVQNLGLSWKWVMLSRSDLSQGVRMCDFWSTFFTCLQQMLTWWFYESETVLFKCNLSVKLGRETRVIKIAAGGLNMGCLVFWQTSIVCMHHRAVTGGWRPRSHASFARIIWSWNFNTGGLNWHIFVLCPPVMSPDIPIHSIILITNKCSVRSKRFPVHGNPARVFRC